MNRDKFKKQSKYFKTSSFSKSYIQFSSVQSLSHIWLFATPWIAACQTSLFITNSQSLLKLMSIESVMPSYINHYLIKMCTYTSRCRLYLSFPEHKFLLLLCFIVTKNENIGSIWANFWLSFPSKLSRTFCKFSNYHQDPCILGH